MDWITYPFPILMDWYLPSLFYPFNHDFDLNMALFLFLSFVCLHHRELTTNITSSKAPTKNYLIKKGQGLADQNHATSNTMKPARI